MAAEHDRKQSVIRISWLWLFFEYDFRNKQTRGRIFLREFSKTGEEIPPSAGETSSPVTAPPHEDIPAPRRRKSTSSSTSSFRKEKKKAPGKFELKGIWRERQLLRLLKNRIIRLIKRLFHSTRFDQLRFDLLLATGDAFLTGWIYGIYCAVLPAIPRSVSVQIAPDFNRNQPEIDLTCALSFRPLVIVINVLIGLMSLPWLRIYRARSSFKRR